MVTCKILIKYQWNDVQHFKFLLSGFWIQHFHIDEGLKPNWKGYPPIGMTTEPLTMSSEYPNPLLSLCRSHSHAGICAYQISLHKDLLLCTIFMLVVQLQPFSYWLRYQKDLLQFQPSMKKETKHVKMIQQQWSQWVSSLQKRGFINISFPPADLWGTVFVILGSGDIY